MPQADTEVLGKGPGRTFLPKKVSPIVVLAIRNLPPILAYRLKAAYNSPVNVGNLAEDESAAERKTG